MPTTAKICGLSSPATVAAAVAGGASHVGFVFFPKSPRDIVPERAGTLATPDGVGRIGVFVDPDDALLAHAIAGARLTGVQLHGDETPERAAAIGARYGVEVWKAVPARTCVPIWTRRAPIAGRPQRILYDAKTPKGTLPGGMGLRFDWKLLDGFMHPAALGAVGRARCRQRRGGGRDHACADRRRVVGCRKRAGRQGCGQGRGVSGAVASL